MQLGSVRFRSFFQSSELDLRTLVVIHGWGIVVCVGWSSVGGGEGGCRPWALSLVWAGSCWWALGVACGARYRWWVLGVVCGRWVLLMGAGCRLWGAVHIVLLHGIVVWHGVIVGSRVVVGCGVIVGHVVFRPKNDDERRFSVIVHCLVAMSLSAMWQL